MISALAITGPTASGKTALSISLARRLGCEIISCDSMQIYREMSIGTAKPTDEELAECPHHLVGFVSARDKYSQEDYRVDAMRAARDITERGKLPLFVGGTGLYLDSVIRGTPLASPPSSPSLRGRITECEASPEKKLELWERLREVDPASAEKIHMNNVRRVARSLEIYELTGKTKTWYDEESRRVSPDIKVGVITLDFHSRDNLYERIDKRVDIMMENGLLNEVESLLREGLLDDERSTAYQAIGYKELLPYLRGESDLASRTEELKQSSRRYAKRQLTWFRSTDAYRLFLDRPDGMMRSIAEIEAELMLAARELLSNIKIN